MTGTRCTVAVCNNSLEKSKKEGQNIVYHKFPKESNLCKLWVQKCRRDGKWNPRSCHVCSVHFTVNDYERDLQAELLNLPPKRKLKPTAVPSLHLFNYEQNDPGNDLNDRNKRYEKKNQKRLVNELLTAGFEVQEEPTEDAIQSFETETVSRTEYVSPIQKYNLPVEQNSNFQKELKVSREIITELRSKLKALEKELSKTKSELIKENSHTVNIKKSLKNVLSNSQLKIILGGKKRVIWNSDDISKAFAIRYFMKRFYVYLRQTLKYPLPGISSLQRWASKLTMRRGLLIDVLRIIEIAGKTMNDFEKACVIQYDEMKVCSIYEYDKIDDKVVGPHSQIQVVMARGLFSKWKQPVYIAFDQKITKDLLFNIISKLHHISYNVVACVSDCGGGNGGMWKELSITIEQLHFPHPHTNQNVYFFADAPHLLKLIRNWLIDTGFTLHNNTKISAVPLKNLIDETDTEVSSCHRLNRSHYECQQAQRQNVALAAQLLSHTTAIALQHYQPGNDKNLAQDTGKFIEIINNWFEVMNSYTTCSSVVTKNPYGLRLEIQNKILDETYETIKTMMCNSKTSLHIFQKGILISISSLKQAELLDDLFNRFHQGRPFKKGRNITKKLIKIAMNEYNHIYPDVVKTFMLQRTFIRIKYLNMKKAVKSDKPNMKRKIVEDGNREKAKKMRKVTT